MSLDEDNIDNDYITPGHYSLDTKYVVYKKFGGIDYAFGTFRTSDTKDMNEHRINFTKIGLNPNWYNNYITWNTSNHTYEVESNDGHKSRVTVYPAKVDVLKTVKTIPETLKQLVSKVSAGKRTRRRNRKYKKRANIDFISYKIQSIITLLSPPFFPNIASALKPGYATCSSAAARTA
jgi:hypothetical protein